MLFLLSYFAFTYTPIIESVAAKRKYNMVTKENQAGYEKEIAPLNKAEEKLRGQQMQLYNASLAAERERDEILSKLIEVSVEEEKLRQGKFTVLCRQFYIRWLHLTHLLFLLSTQRAPCFAGEA